MKIYKPHHKQDYMRTDYTDEELKQLPLDQLITITLKMQKVIKYIKQQQSDQNTNNATDSILNSISFGADSSVDLKQNMPNNRDNQKKKPSSPKNEIILPPVRNNQLLLTNRTNSLPSLLRQAQEKKKTSKFKKNIFEDEAEVQNQFMVFDNPKSQLFLFAIDEDGDKSIQQTLQTTELRNQIDDNAILLNTITKQTEILESVYIKHEKNLKTLKNNQQWFIMMIEEQQRKLNDTSNGEELLSGLELEEEEETEMEPNSDNQEK